MKLNSMNLSGNRLSPIVLALAAALALPSAFAQTTPAPATPTDPASVPTAPTQAPAVPMQDSTPPPESLAATTPSKPAAFKDLDANKDGKLSKDEVASDAMWTADFDAADANKDGYISKAEFKKHEAGKKTAKVESTHR